MFCFNTPEMCKQARECKKCQNSGMMMDKGFVYIENEWYQNKAQTQTKQKKSSQV